MRKIFIVLLIMVLVSGCASFQPATLTPLKEHTLTRQQTFQAALNAIVKCDGTITFSDKESGLITAKAGECVYITVDFIDASPTFKVLMSRSCWGFSKNLEKYNTKLLNQYELEKKRLQ